MIWCGGCPSGATARPALRRRTGRRAPSRPGSAPQPTAARPRGSADAGGGRVLLVASVLFAAAVIVALAVQTRAAALPRAAGGARPTTSWRIAIHSTGRCANTLFRP